MSTTRNLTVNVKLRIDESLQQALERLALLNDRSVAAEMRRALRAHVQDAEGQEASS